MKKTVRLFVCLALTLAALAVCCMAAGEDEAACHILGVSFDPGDGTSASAEIRLVSGREASLAAVLYGGSGRILDLCIKQVRPLAGVQTVTAAFTHPEGEDCRTVRAYLITGDSAFRPLADAGTLTVSGVYAQVYEDGTLVFRYSDEPVTGHGSMLKSYPADMDAHEMEQIPWRADSDLIVRAEFADDIAPSSTAFWFFGLKKLTAVDHIGRLHTQNVTDMRHMFSNCESLASLDMSGFDTSSVWRMNSMFKNCGALTELDVSGFDTSSVTDMSWMFSDCVGLRILDLSCFDTSSVTNMMGMFSGCSGLEELDVNSFDTSGTEDMESMFYSCEGLHAVDVSGFDTSSVWRMNSMFKNCGALTELDVSGFNTVNVTDMKEMFCHCGLLTALDVSGFSTHGVKTMAGMFTGCESLTELDVSRFHTGRVESMENMFMDCSSLTELDVSRFETRNVINMEAMFYGCRGLTALDLSNFDSYSLDDTSGMFYGCEKLAVIYSSGTFSINAFKDSSSMFFDCKALEGGQGTVFKSDKTNGAYARIDNKDAEDPGYFTRKEPEIPDFYFYAQLYQDGTLAFRDSKLELEGHGRMNSYFAADPYGYREDEIPWSGKGVKQVIIADNIYTFSTAYWFKDCVSLTSVTGLGRLHLPEDADMGSMFYGCGELSELDFTGMGMYGVKDMSCMFYGCSGLTSLDLSMFDTAGLQNMRYMFCRCGALKNVDLSGFDTSAVTDMSMAFSGCAALETLDVTGFDTSRVTDMYSMFEGCGLLTVLDVSSFDTGGVKSMSRMFFNCECLETIYASGTFLTAGVNDDEDMFCFCHALVGGAGTAYVYEHSGAEYARIDGGPDSPGYFTAK